MEKYLTIKEKIFIFLDSKNIKKSDFYEATGIESSNFKGKNRLSQPGGEMLVKILTAYPDLSADWLLTGRGEMLKTNSTPEGTTHMEQPPLSYKDNEKNAGNQENTQIISELLSTIKQQAEEIGRLKERIEDLQRRRGDNVGDAPNSNIAATG